MPSLGGGFGLDGKRKIIRNCQVRTRPPRSTGSLIIGVELQQFDEIVFLQVAVIINHYEEIATGDPYPPISRDCEPRPALVFENDGKVRR